MQTVMAASDSETDEIDENAIHDVEARADLLESVYIYIANRRKIPRRAVSKSKEGIIRKKAVNLRIVNGEMIFIKKRRGKEEVHMHYSLATYHANI